MQLHADAPLAPCWYHPPQCPTYLQCHSLGFKFFSIPGLSPTGSPRLFPRACVCVTLCELVFWSQGWSSHIHTVCGRAHQPITTGIFDPACEVKGQHGTAVNKNTKYSKYRCKVYVKCMKGTYIAIIILADRDINE